MQRDNVNYYDYSVQSVAPTENFRARATHSVPPVRLRRARTARTHALTHAFCQIIFRSAREVLPRHGRAGALEYDVRHVASRAAATGAVYVGGRRACASDRTRFGRLSHRLASARARKPRRRYGVVRNCRRFYDFFFPLFFLFSVIHFIFPTRTFARITIHPIVKNNVHTNS